jgi:hypothetical protein
MNRIIHALISITLLTGLTSCSTQHIMEAPVKNVSVDSARELILTLPLPLPVHKA